VSPTLCITSPAFKKFPKIFERKPPPDVSIMVEGGFYYVTCNKSDIIKETI